MFLPPRFVAIDDNPKHLNAILDVFQSLGSPCLGIVFDPAHALEKQRFEGVRGLFLDLHLLDSTVDIDETKARERDFPHIVHILETCISPAGGPFVLVIWTRHAALAEGLGEYLDQNLNPEKPHACPLAVTSLPKTDFINADTGEIVPDKAEALRDAVTSAVSEKAQLAALLAWEADVQRAAGATLSAVMELVPDAQRKSTLYASGLDEVLSRLARAAVGRPHVEADPKAAIAAALAPMLTDRVVNQEGLPADTAVWQEALTWEGGEPLDSTRAGKVNRMLHVAIPPSEKIRPTDWGAVVEFPNERWNDDSVTESVRPEKENSCSGVNSRSGERTAIDAVPDSFAWELPVTMPRTAAGRFCICLASKSIVTSDENLTTTTKSVYPLPNGRRPRCYLSRTSARSCLLSTRVTP